MTTPHDLEAKFWKTLGSDRNVMLGLEGVNDVTPSPMTAMEYRDKVAEVRLD